MFRKKIEFYYMVEQRAIGDPMGHVELPSQRISKGMYRSYYRAAISELSGNSDKLKSGYSTKNVLARILCELEGTLLFGPFRLG